MKKILASLLVLALCAPAMAATISIVNNGDLTATVTIDSTADGKDMVGLGLDVDVDAGNVTAVSIDTADFNIYPDAAYTLEAGAGYNYGDGTPVADKTAPGQVSLPLASFALSFANLNGVDVAGADGASSVQVTITVSEACNLTVCENSTRGGIVATDATGLVADCAVEAIIPSGCACKGDLNGDTFINTLDMSMLIGKLSAKGAPYIIPTGDPLFDDCGDMNSDTFVNTLDMSMLIGQLTAAGAPYIISCP